MKIPFNKPFLTGNELTYIFRAVENQQLSGDGYFTKKCHAWLEEKIGCKKALLTHSCTAALEMAAILIDINPGDEVIMPSYTFVSTANAFVLRGAVPVFVDIRPDTLNIDETKIEAAITSRTKAIVPVHYAGVSCEMDTITNIAERYRLWVIEDAAHGILSYYKGRPLGSIGHLGTLSFHETKNIIAGEGGALLINEPRFIERAEIVREKGTNRSKFFRGELDKYTWVDIGSSYLLGELTAAFLFAQFEEGFNIIKERSKIWHEYYRLLSPVSEKCCLRLPVIPDTCKHNAHMFYLILNDIESRTSLINKLGAKGISSVFHYIPLHSSPAGRKFSKASGDMKFTDELSARLIRLPMWKGLDVSTVQLVVEAIVNQ